MTRRSFARGFTLAAYLTGDLEASAPPPPVDIPPIPRCPHSNVRAQLTPDEATLVVACEDCGAILKRAAAALASAPT